MEFNIKKIKVLVLDVDGTLTDGKVYISNEGEFVKAFNVKDGYGIKEILPTWNITPIIVTGRTSEIVTKRAKELGIKHVFQGVTNKLQKLKEICKRLNVDMSNVAYIGDDLNDLECIEASGFKACPNDAVDEIKQRCDYISSRCGGCGAVREIIDKLISLEK